MDSAKYLGRKLVLHRIMNLEDPDASFTVGPHPIVWMQYDEIAVKTVKSLKQFFCDYGDEDDDHGDEGIKEKNERVRHVQTIHLIDTADAYRPEVARLTEAQQLLFYEDGEQMSPGDHPLVFGGDGREPGFVGFCTIKLSPVVKEAAFRCADSKLTFFERINEWLLGFTGIKSPVCIRWLESLGIEDYMLVVGCENISTFMRICLSLRMCRAEFENGSGTFLETVNSTNLVDATYSFIASNHAKISDLKSDVETRVFLTMRPDGILEEIQEEIRRIEGASLAGTLGKYDLVIRFPEGTDLSVFSGSGLLSEKSAHFLRNILCTNTRFFLPSGALDDITPLKISNTPVSGLCARNGTDSYKSILRTFKICMDLLKKNETLHEALWLLNVDFVRNVKSSACDEWHDDLADITFAFSECCRLYLDDTMFTKFWLHGEVEEVVRNMRHLYLHINQADRMFFEMPSVNVRYTGSYDKILHAYYGVAKSLIGYVKSLPRTNGNAQADMYPIITFEYESVIHAHIYMKVSNQKFRERALFDDDVLVDQDALHPRLVGIHLPYDALSNPLRYLPKFCHEIYHFSRPFDRVHRNRLLIRLFCGMLIHEGGRRVAKAVLTALDENSGYARARAGLLERATDIYTDNDFISHFTGWLNSEGFHYTDEQLKKYDKILPLDSMETLDHLRSEFVKGNNQDVQPATYTIFPLVMSALERALRNEKLVNRYISFGAVDEDAEARSLGGDKVGGVLKREWTIAILRDSEKLRRIVRQASDEANYYDNFGLYYGISATEGVREACADVFMIETLEMDPEEYLFTLYEEMRTGRLHIKFEASVNGIVWSDASLSSLISMQYSVSMAVRLYIVLTRTFVVHIENFNLWIKERIKAMLIRMSRGHEDLHKETLVCADALGAYLNMLVNTYMKTFPSQYIDLINHMMDATYAEPGEESWDYERAENTAPDRPYESYRQDAALSGSYSYPLPMNSEHDRPARAVRAREVSGLGKIQSDLNYLKQVYQRSETIYDAFTKDGFADGYFDNEIDFIEHYQKQLKFADLKRIVTPRARRTARKSPFSESVPSRGKPWTRPEDRNVVEVRDLSEYIGVITRISAMFKEDIAREPNRVWKSELLPIWFRGHGNLEHMLLPGAMREVGTCPEFGCAVSPYQLVFDYMSQFQAMAAHAIELSRFNIHNGLDWMVTMQHYHMPTSLLDWSSDPLVALYFAVEACRTRTLKIDRGEPETPPEKTGTAVFILSPIQMSIARRMLECKSVGSPERDAYPIVNLSLSQFDDEFKDFVVNPEKLELPRRNREWEKRGTKEHQEGDWPIPVITTQGNLRIQAQSGNFTAFNLMSKYTEIGGRKSYRHLTIESMQEAFWEKYPGEPSFLYKIIIREEYIDAIYAELCNMGVTQLFVYPQLDHMGQNARTQVQSFWYRGSNVRGPKA